MAINVQYRFLTLFIFTIALFSPVQANDESDDNNYVMFGVASLPEFMGASDNTVAPFLISRFTFAGIDTEIEGLVSRFNLQGRRRGLQYGPALNVTLPRDDSFVDQSQVQQLRDIDTALELGGFIGFEYPSANHGVYSANITVLHDVVDAHNGFLISPEFDYFFTVSRMLRMSFGVKATWADKNYMETYFGVDAQDSLASGISEYSAGAGLRDVEVEIFTLLSFSPTLGIFSRLGYSELLSDARDSTIITEVGQRDQVFLGMGVFYAF